MQPAQLLHAYNEIVHMNQVAGNHPEPDNEDVFDLSANLIKEEIRESIAECDAQNSNKLAHELCDLFVVLYGMMYRCGYQFEDNLNSTYLEEIDEQFGEEVSYKTIRETLLRMEGLIDSVVDFETKRRAVGLFVPKAVKIALLTAFHEQLKGIARHLPWDMAPDLTEVYHCNLSKFDTTMEGFLATQAKFREIGVDVLLRQSEVDGVTYYVAISSYDQQGSDGKFYKGGKFLKSINTRKPKFADRPLLVVESAPTQEA